MISGGQVSGLASQISAGQVQYAIVFIGYNDFSILTGTYQEIYSNQISDAALQIKVNQVIANITSAVNTLHNAGALGIVVTTIADPGAADMVKAQYPNATQRQRATNAINAVNTGIRTLASSKVSINEWGAFAESIVTKDILTIGGVQIQVNGVGNEPHNLSLADMHAGTVFSGLIANSIFIEPMNQAYNLGITPLSDHEILQNAGLTDTPSAPIGLTIE
jgi:hypothetical protein